MDVELQIDDAYGATSTSSTLAEVKQSILHLLEWAPSDARAFSSLKKDQREYQGILQVISSQGRFVAESVENTLQDLLASLFGQIQRQLHDWRESRFNTK